VIPNALETKKIARKKEGASNMSNSPFIEKKGRTKPEEIGYKRDQGRGGERLGKDGLNTGREKGCENTSKSRGRKANQTRGRYKKNEKTEKEGKKKKGLKGC